MSLGSARASGANILTILLALVIGALPLRAQVSPGPSNPAVAPAKVEPGTTVEEAEKKAKAAEQLRTQERQRILGVVPNFNTSNVPDAVALSPGQKFHLAARSALDPFTFLAAAADAGLDQAQNNFPGYHQGALGYAKRFGASYLDSFDGTMIGNALFPVLLKQDPRYFRKGTGTFNDRLLYAIGSTFRCKNDDGKWAPNYSNLLGNLAAGGISNAYYPQSDRGFGLTIQRAVTVTAEGALGAVFVEFWPDISRKLFPKHVGKDLP